MAIRLIPSHTWDAFLKHPGLSWEYFLSLSNTVTKQKAAMRTHSHDRSTVLGEEI